MLTKEQKKLIDEVIYIVDNTTNDWFKIKALIINYFPPRLRGNFSVRLQSTRKHILNSFDWEVINYWQEKTGISLWIDPNKLSPEGYVFRKRGESLKAINEERKRQKQERIAKEANRIRSTG